MTLFALQNVSINIPSTSESGKVIDARHPHYSYMWRFWEKWRLTFEGGEDFIERYMCKLSTREGTDDFADRKRIAYCPSFATAAINDIKNAIFQRIADVSRVGGPQSYMQAVTGVEGGVDFQGSSMGTFVGTEVIDELLVMSKVGVLVDNFQDLGTTLAEKGSKRPYLSPYIAENILSWAPKHPVDGFTHLLLREVVDEVNDQGLPIGQTEQYRFMQLTPEGVFVQFYDKDGKEGESHMLDLKKIPFVSFEIDRSLMKDAANYQISLLNLESADISFAMKANFPLYYEFYDHKKEPIFGKGVAEPNNTGTDAEKLSRSKEVRIGSTIGRRFPDGLNEPGYASPDPDTLRVSMEKGQKLKEDIRSIVNLNLQALNPQRESADSKEADNKSLEASLSFVGLVLQKGEQQIAEHWASFEGEGKKVRVTYPKTYSLKSEKDRRDEATELDKLSDKVPSETFRREVKKKIAKTLMGGELIDTAIEKIIQEIDEAEVITSDTNIILSAHKSGLVDDVTASDALGFDGKKTVPQAQKDRAERIKLTMEAQGGPENADGNRGAPEFDKGATPDEKEGKGTRGKQDNTDMGSEQK